ncbi:hypothetical protein [Streptomyces sp. NPDC057429]|uniref:hypothetical protein n=1 Tax=Streptomyces sp. NPDC057429 TaxID=3346130 RepID=UPI00369FF397
MSVVVACDGIEQRGAGLAPPDVLGAAGVVGRLRAALAGLPLPLPRAADGRPVPPRWTPSGYGRATTSPRSPPHRSGTWSST